MRVNLRRVSINEGEVCVDVRELVLLTPCDNLSEKDD
jgi:hypothetical protein